MWPAKDPLSVTLQLHYDFERLQTNPSANLSRLPGPLPLNEAQGLHHAYIAPTLKLQYPLGHPEPVLKESFVTLGGKETLPAALS